MLVTITIVLALAVLAFMGSSTFIKRAAAVRDTANMKSIWSGVIMYAGDNNDQLPGGLFSGQKPVYTENGANGRLAHFLAPYFGYDTPREGQPIEAMTSSWQKTDAQKAINAYWFRIDVPISNSTSTFRPWGYAYAQKPMRMSAAMSMINPSRTWAFTDLDQLHPDAKGAGWFNEIPAEMAHGSYRLAMYFDGSCNKVNVNNEPK